MSARGSGPDGSASVGQANRSSRAAVLPVPRRRTALHRSSSRPRTRAVLRRNRRPSLWTEGRSRDHWQSGAACRMRPRMIKLGGSWAGSGRAVRAAATVVITGERARIGARCTKVSVPDRPQDVVSAGSGLPTSDLSLGPDRDCAAGSLPHATASDHDGATLPSFRAPSTRQARERGRRGLSEAV
jgi:hypothetical protein